MGVLTKGPNGGALGGHTGGLPRVHRGFTEGPPRVIARGVPRYTEAITGHLKYSSHVTYITCITCQQPTLSPELPAA